MFWYTKGIDKQNNVAIARGKGEWVEVELGKGEGKWGQKESSMQCADDIFLSCTIETCVVL